MNEIFINDGDQIPKDPRDETVLTMDWTEHFEAGVELQDEGEFNVFCISKPREDPVTLVVEFETLLPGHLSVQFRIRGGRRGARYKVSHFVVTNESPEQAREKSFEVRMRDK